jgi:hypothetical protein
MCLLQHVDALGGQAWRGAATAVKQLVSHPPLEQADLITDSGLADAQALGGFAEIQIVRGLDEQLELPERETHGTTPNV